jgi:hypothetical protein
MSTFILKSLAIAAAVALTELINHTGFVSAQVECTSCTEDCVNDQSACEGEAGCGFSSPSCLQRCELAEKLCSQECQGTVCTPAGADLTGSWTSLTQTCKKAKKKEDLQCSLKGTFQVENVGNEPAINAELLFVLSADSVLDENDLILKRVNYSSVLKKNKKAKPLDISLPQGSDAVGLFAIAFIDSEGDVVETNEANNIIPSGPIPSP